MGYFAVLGIMLVVLGLVIIKLLYVDHRRRHCSVRFLFWLYMR